MNVKKTSILIVDDDQDLLDLLVDIFDPKKFKVVTANDGIQGNFKFQNQEFDLIITDIRMPKMDGLAFAKLILKSKNVPILFISASTEDYKSDLELFDNIDVLSKPFSSNDVLNRVDRLINKKNEEKPNPASKVIEYNPGDIVIAEGTKGDEIYFVKEGTLRVVKTLESGKKIEITTIGMGEIVGEMSLLIDAKRTASVVAATKVLLMEIPKEKLNEVLNSQPKWFKILFQTISKRLQATTELLVKEKMKG
jgi:CheY-like chemotaxis protein